MPLESETPISSGELVNVNGCCSLRAPEGENWTIEIDGSKGEVTFLKKHDERKSTFISIGSGYAEPSSESKTEDQSAASIFATEEKIMRERGSKRSYLIKDIEYYKKTIRNKKIHVMKYIISDHSKVPMEIGYLMHLYFPNYTRDPKTYYVFLIGDVVMAEGVRYSSGTTVIDKIIDSFQRE